MKRARFTDKQIVRISQGADRASVAEVAERDLEIEVMKGDRGKKVVSVQVRLEQRRYALAGE
jgi:hypothetical protein